MTRNRQLERTLVELIGLFTPQEGVNPSPWPGLAFFRASRPMPPRRVVYKSSLCVVAQGSKRAMLGGRVYSYDPLHYLVLSVALPAEAEIFEASPERPFLSLSLEIDAADVSDLVIEMAERDSSTSGDEPVAGIRVSSMSEALGDALVRFLRALDDPTDRRVLGPMISREILYHVLSDDQGDLLRAVALRDSGSQRVARVIRYLESNFDQPLDVPAIAKVAGMSTSSLHHAFKEVTSFTPIQYLKQLRLHEARSLMLSEGCGAGEAAYRVGYGSPSQFSREFKRFFGETPTREVERFRNHLTPALSYGVAPASSGE